jgi:hypothetical protein
VRDARRSAGSGDGAGVRAARDVGDGGDVSAAAGGSERDASEDTDGECVPPGDDDEDFEEKVAIATATNTNKPSRETKAIN